MDQVGDRARKVEASEGVLANERLTGLAGAVLLPLVVIIIVTAANAHALLPIHIFVGVLLIGPVLVMIGSTGYRFLRYYSGSPAFLRRGVPPIRLRLLAPLVLITTILVIGSGLALLVTGPSLLVFHVFSSLFWMPMIAIHAVAHVPQIPRLIANEWAPSLAQVAGRERRVGLILGAVVAGTIGAVAIQPLATTFITWSNTIGYGPGPFIVGTVLTAVALAVTRPTRWKSDR